jgi:hypothetical protein
MRLQYEYELASSFSEISGVSIFIVLNFAILKQELFIPVLLDQCIIGPFEVNFKITPKTKNGMLNKIRPKQANKISNNLFAL